MRVLVAAVVIAIAATGCSAEKPSALPAAAKPSASSISVEEANKRLCSDVFADGASALVADTKAACAAADGSFRGYGPMEVKCKDGRTLMWNDLVWGYEGDRWHAHPSGAELVAPKVDRDACAG